MARFVINDSDSDDEQQQQQQQQQSSTPPPQSAVSLPSPPQVPASPDVRRGLPRAEPGSPTPMRNGVTRDKGKGKEKAAGAEERDTMMEPPAPSVMDIDDLDTGAGGPSQNKDKAQGGDEHPDMIVIDEDDETPGTLPTSFNHIPWARHLGVDPKRLKVMQQSLFRMPEEAAALRRSLPPEDPHEKKRPQQKPKQKPEQKVQFADPLPSGKRKAPASSTLPQKFARVDRKGSIALNTPDTADGDLNASSERAYTYTDAGLMIGWSWRSGWGPGARLVHLGKVGGLVSNGPLPPTNTPTLSVARPLRPPSTPIPTLKKLLHHHLTTSPIHLNPLPTVSPAPDLAFSDFTALFPPSDRSPLAQLLRLGHILFDPHPSPLDEDYPEPARTKVEEFRQREMLSRWLGDAVKDTVERDVKALTTTATPQTPFSLHSTKQKHDPNADPARAAFLHLTGGQIDLACTTAQDGGYAHLPVLLSQLGGEDEIKSEVLRQLNHWRQQRVDRHMDDDVRRLYALVAGTVDFLAGSNSGEGKVVETEGGKDLWIAEGLDWKRCFGLVLWYGEPMDETIARVVEVYDRLWKTGRMAPPKAWYTENSQSKSTKIPNPNAKDAAPLDGLYLLLKAFSDPEESLADLFEPRAHSPSGLDYALPWHLYTILVRCMRIRDQSVDAEGDMNMDASGSRGGKGGKGRKSLSEIGDILAVNYAQQLEDWGMCQEAVFVLLHMENPEGRVQAIKRLLVRWAPKLEEWIILGIAGSLRIPLVWLHEARAIYALSRGRIHDAYESYVSAEMHEEAHRLAAAELAPQAVLSKDWALVRRLFRRSMPSTLDGLDLAGQVFLQYADIVEEVPRLLKEVRKKDAVPDAMEASRLDDFTRLIPRLLSRLPDILNNRTDPNHDAALSEMTSNLVRLLTQVNPLALAESYLEPALDSGTKLRQLHATVYAKFLNAISAPVKVA